MNFKKTNKLSVVFILFSFFSLVISAQDVYKKNQNVDVEHYVFQISLNDENNIIQGETTIILDLKDNNTTLAFDLIGKSGYYGMELTGVYEEEEQIDYRFVDNKILIDPTVNKEQKRIYKIKYQGIPEKGLVIDTTKYGQRSFFGDNWPNLARHWLACVDHPYDKASVEFKVIAPEYYDVVTTGKKIEESNIGQGFKLTHYIEPSPVAMKVATIGVTKFASMHLGNVGDIDVSAWVYPENRMAGFDDFQEATEILNYFVEKVGPYSYAKLANMQVKTIWGGLENAGTISYNETYINGNKELQRLMAHEIAHQWFGNSATEESWNHVWLSEGFATYFAILYQESVDGNEKRKSELLTDRKEVIEYYVENPLPVVDLSIKDPNKVLNNNTYQKAGWVLNMLRHKLGDEVFWKGIQSYYQKYQNANVITSDFQHVMEEVSGLDLHPFFNQWLLIKGHPQLKWSWKYKKQKLLVEVEQIQKHHVFEFPLEIGIVQNGIMKTESVEIKDRTSLFEIEINQKPDRIVIDPEVWLMYEEIR